ncbi:MAG: hypothetical protein ACO2O1_06590 [Candidatus Caldarchaeales archaeon]|jgi:hypothetical protein
MVVRKVGRGVVGVLDDGTVLTEEELKENGEKVIRVGKIKTL